MNFKGNSILGDKSYGKSKKKFKKIDSNIEKKINNFNRQALHAKCLGFIHPTTKKEVFFEARRPKDFDTLMDSTFSAVKFSNQPYKEAMSGKVPKSSKTRWDQAMRIANGLMSGGINPVAGQFYFTEDEINKMKGRKSFDFSIVKEVGTIGKYKIFSY